MALTIIFIAVIIAADAVITFVMARIYKRQNEILIAQNNTLKDIFEMIFQDNKKE